MSLRGFNPNANPNAANQAAADKQAQERAAAERAALLAGRSSAPSASTPVAGGIAEVIARAAQAAKSQPSPLLAPVAGAPGVTQQMPLSPIAPSQPGLPATAPTSISDLFGGATTPQDGGLSSYGLSPDPQMITEAAGDPNAITSDMPATMPAQPAMPAAAPQGAAPITGATTIFDLVSRGLGVSEPQAQIGPDGLPVAPQPPVPRVPQLPPMPQLTPPTGPQMLPQYAGADSRANFAPGGTPQLLPEAQARVDLANAPTFADWANQLQQMGIAGNPAAATFGAGMPAPRVPQLPPMPQLTPPSGIPSGLAAPQPAPQASPYGNPQAPQSGVQAPAGPQAPGGVQSPAAPAQQVQAQAQPTVAPAPVAGPAPAPAVDPVVADLQRQVAELRARIPAAPAAPAAPQQPPAAESGANDPGRPYTTTPYERPDEAAPIEQPQEQPAEAPAEPELEPAMAGSPLQNAKPTEPAIKDGQLMTVGGNMYSSKGVPTNLLARVGLSRAILSQFVDRSVVGTMNVPDRPMDNPDDIAALAYEYLKKQPQENFLAVILDVQGRPIQILRHTLGQISSTEFMPHVLAGVVASTRGARTVYVVHNHPSTTTRFSQADVQAAQFVSKSIESVGLRFGGSLVVTDGDAYEGKMTPKYIFHPGGEDVDQTPNPTTGNEEDNPDVRPVVLFDDRPVSDTTADIQVVERTFEVRREALFPRISNSQDAVEQIPSLLRNLPGVALLDKAGRLVGVVQMSISEMRNVSSAAGMIYPEQGQARDYIKNEDERANPDQDKSVYKRRKSPKLDIKTGAWNNPLAMLMAALERSNAEQVIISSGKEEADQGVASDAVRNLQKAIMRVGGTYPRTGAAAAMLALAGESTYVSKITVLDVINNNKGFRNQVLSPEQYGRYSSADRTGGRLSTGQRLGFDDPGASYGNQDEQEKAPIEGGEDGGAGIEGIVRNGLQEGETVGETNPEDPNAGAEFARQEREAGARVNGPQASGLEAAQPAEPIIKKTRKPRAKPAAPNPSVFPTKLDSTLPFGRLTGDQMAQFGLSDAMLDQFVEHSTVGHVMSGVEFVKSAEDAAHVVAGMRKRPQEQIILLVTDKNGRPIQIAGHQLGGPTSTGFNPGILIGTAASTPGAAKVWFIHNHPSGKSSLSPADLTAGRNIEGLLDAAGLEYMGTMAVAGTRFAQLTPSGRQEGNRAIKPAARKFKVPITERMFSFRVSQNSTQVSDPQTAMLEAERIFGKDQPGVILLDNSNRMVATIPLAADVLQAMKAKIPGTDQTGFNRFVAGIDRSNPVNVMIYTASLDKDVARQVIQNMSGVAQATKLTVLDAFGAGGVSRQSDIRAYGSDFNETKSEYTPDGGQASQPQTLRDVVDQAAKKKNELEVGEGEPDVALEPGAEANQDDQLTEPAMPYDDGENTRIPGSERDDRLKRIEKQMRQLEVLGYMHIGHGYDADPANPGAWKKKAKLWSLSTDNRIVFSKTIDKLEVAHINKLKRELKEAKEKLKVSTDKQESGRYEYRIRLLTSSIDRLEGDMKSSSSPITHMRSTSGFSETEYAGRNPQGRVEITDDGVLVSITRFRGNMESVADERMLMRELRDEVAKNLNVSPEMVHVVDMDGGTIETDNPSGTTPASDSAFTPEDGSAREPGAEYGSEYEAGLVDNYKSMAEAGMDDRLATLGDRQLADLAARAAEASAQLRQEAGENPTDAQLDAINTAEMEAFDEWMAENESNDTGDLNEPGMAYDDGENQAIPGGNRQAWIKQQAELRAKNELPGAKRIQWWTDVGHKVGKKNREKTWLWAYDKQGKLQVINAEELRTKMMDDFDMIGANPTHLDWEESYFPGLLAGAAHGRIDATEDVVRVSLAGRINDPTFREQVKQELAEYIGADVDKVKGYDFTGDGMPELFNRTEADQDGDMDQIVSDLEGMDVNEAKAYFKNNPDKALLVSMKGLPPHLEKILQAMRDVGYNETKAYLDAHPIGRMLLANGRIVLVRDASEIPGLSPLEAASGGFNALVLGNDREATYFVGGAISEAEIDALIKHEVGVHMGIGKDTDLVNDLYAELWSLIENGDFGDMDKIMAKDAVTDAFAVVASHYGMRSDPNNRKQQGDRILDKMHAGMAATKVRYTDARIISILKDEGLTQEQIDNFMRMFHEETLGYLMNIMARRDARVNAPKDSLFAIIIQWIKATMIRMAYANSSGGSRPLAGLTMGAIRTSSKVARFAGLNQLSKLLEIRPGDVRAIAQGYAKAYAAGKEIGMPETRASTNESDMQHEARDAQEARVAGTARDAVTDAATYSNENITLFSKRLPGQDPIKPEDQAGTKESVARHQGKKTGLLQSDSSSDRTNPPIPLSALQVETGRQMLWDEQPSPGISKYGEMTEDPAGVIPLSQIGVGPTRDSSFLVADESGNPIELPRITSIQGFAGKLGDLEALLNLPVHITQGRQGTGIHGNFDWEKDTKKHKDIGQMSAGFGLEHASWKHGWELDALASATTWVKGDHLEAIKKIMADATHGLVSMENGQVDAINVYSQKTGMTVVLRVGGRNRKMLHVITVLKAGKPGAEFKTDKAIQTFKDNGAKDVTVIGDTQATPQANEPGADYGQAEQTGEQLQAREEGQIREILSHQGGGPAGPALFNAIPPTPPPPTPTTPTSPAPAPLNPPATNDDMARRVGDVLRGRYFDGISTKAHQNAERTGSAAVRAVADIIHTRPGTENPSSDRDLPKAIMTARAKYQNKFNEIMRPLRDQLGRMTSEQREQFYRELVDQITGRTNIQPGVSGHAATQLIALLKELHDYRTAAGEDLGQVQQYFPAVYNSALITANRTAFIADATRAYEIELSQDPNLTPQEIQAKAAAAAIALYRTHTRGMGDAEWASIFNSGQSSATENSSKERVFGRQAQGIMAKWQTPDPFYVISRYIGSAVKRAELVRRFGPEGKNWEAMSNAMEADGVPIETINEMAQLVQLAAGLGTTPLDNSERMFMDTVNLYTAAAAMGKSAMNNLYEPAAMGIRGSTLGNPFRTVTAYAETWARFIRNLVQMLPVLGDHVGPTFWQEYGEHIGSIHNSLDDAWMSMHAMEHGMEETSPAMRWITNRVYQANLMESTENAKLQASHALGHAYILDHAGMLDGSHWIARLLKFDTRSTAEEALLELGIPKSKQDAFAAWCAMVKQTKDRAARMAMLTDGSEMARLYEEAQVRFSHQSAVRANRAHKPVFQDAVLGRLALQLMSFSYSYYSEVTDRMYRMASRAVTTRDMPAIQRINMLLPLMLSPLTVVAMGALFESKDYLFPTESSEKRKKEHWIYKLFNASSFAGAFGPKIEMATKFIARDQPPGGIAGQTIVSAGRVGKKAIELSMDDTKSPAQKEAELKAAAGRAAVAPIKGAAVITGSAIHPVAGAAAVALTNDTGWSNELQAKPVAPKKGSLPPSEELPGKRR